jgi:F-type H+-transporting ATPase subunit alpha
VRLVELLKQPQFNPMSLGEQVTILFAGTRGFLDKYPVDKLKNYEPQLLNFVKTKYHEIMKEIDDKKVLSPELEKKMKEVLTEFDSVYVTD